MFELTRVCLSHSPKGSWVYKSFESLRSISCTQAPTQTQTNWFIPLKGEEEEEEAGSSVEQCGQSVKQDNVKVELGVIISEVVAVNIRQEQWVKTGEIMSILGLKHIYI